MRLDSYLRIVFADVWNTRGLRALGIFVSDATQHAMVIDLTSRLPGYKSFVEGVD